MSRYPHPADMNPDSSDPRSPYYDDSRDEWIAERADELADERLADAMREARDSGGYVHDVASTALRDHDQEVGNGRLD